VSGPRFTFTGCGKTKAEIAGKHKHRPADRRVPTHSGLLTECELCGRFITYVVRAGKGFWRIR
jgi:hypothetical protein